MRLVNPLSVQDLGPISSIVDTGPKFSEFCLDWSISNPISISYLAFLTGGIFLDLEE